MLVLKLGLALFKYQRLVKYMMADSFPDIFHTVISLVLSCLFLLNTGFETWIVTFYQLMLVVLDVMHEADITYSIRSTW